MKLVRLHRDSKHGFGMVITCGNTYDTILHGAFIEAVHPESPAELVGSIGAGDQIMSINGTNVQNDHFLRVVDLLQCSPDSVDLIIAKSNDIHPHIPAFLKNITEKPYTKSKTWTVGNGNINDMPSLEKSEEDSSKFNKMPIPTPRKKWAEQDNKSSHFSVPDLTLNHSSNGKMEGGSDLDADYVNFTRENIPDIIASQMKNMCLTQDVTNGNDEDLRDCDLFLPMMKNGDNLLLPGEVFHVVLDKKGGSLGLNIYQGTEPSLTEERYIYIHSVIPNGAADLDGRIKPGDKLLEVDGDSLDNLSYKEVVTKLRETSQVAHLVLERGNLIETVSMENKMSLKNLDHTSRKHSHLSNLLRNNMNGTHTSNGASKYAEYISKKDESSVSAEAFDMSNDCDLLNSASDYSSLPNYSGDLESLYDAKDVSCVSQGDFSPNGESKQTNSSPLNAKGHNSTNRFRNNLTSYSSTPNLADNSDEEESNDLYRMRSIESLTPHFMQPHKALMEYYSNYPCVRGSLGDLHEIPAVPIRKKKLKKLADVYNYCNSENTFNVQIQKSSRGLGLSTFGGVDGQKRDPFSQLIRIRRLYPLQPALECGKLALGDVILEVNGTKTVGLTNMEALEILRSAPVEVNLKIFRPSKSLIPCFSTLKGALWPFLDSPSSSASSSLSCKDTKTYTIETGIFEVTLVKQEGSLGFTISRNESMIDSAEGIYIKALIREPASTDGRLQSGDKILQVNGTSISTMSHMEAIEFLRNAPDTVTLCLCRNDPPFSPGVDDYSTSKPLRWEAVSFLKDRVKNKDSNESVEAPKERKIKRKLDRCSNAPSNNSNSSTESYSTNSSSAQEHTIEEEEEESPELCNGTEELIVDGTTAGLQRNQRPKSLDMLNTSDRKRCPALFPDEDSFHRQSSVMCSNVDSKTKEDSTTDGSTKQASETLLKWRGSTFPHVDDERVGTDVCEVQGYDSNQKSEEEERPAESGSDDERPVPFPRTTSRSSDWVNTFDVDLDRGWHGRLGFSLFDPPATSPDSPRNQLPRACEVKTVHPGSLADRDGRIKVGDRLVEVNRECMLSKSASEVIEILRRTRSLIRMVFCRLETRT